MPSTHTTRPNSNRFRPEPPPMMVTALRSGRTRLASPPLVVVSLGPDADAQPESKRAAAPRRPPARTAVRVRRVERRPDGAGPPIAWSLGERWGRSTIRVDVRVTVRPSGVTALTIASTSVSYTHLTLPTNREV